MKHYTLTLEVPDDFDPEQLEINASYPEQCISLIGEGFFNIEDIAKGLVLEYPKATDTSVAILKYPLRIMEQDNLPELRLIAACLEDLLGCKVFSMVNDMEILIQNSAEAIQMLQKMIGLIKSRSIIKLS